MGGWGFAQPPIQLPHFSASEYRHVRVVQLFQYDMSEGTYQLVVQQSER